MAENIPEIACAVCGNSFDHLLCNACCGEKYCPDCLATAEDAYPGYLMSQPHPCTRMPGACDILARIVEACAKVNARQAAYEERQRQHRADALLAQQRLAEERARETPEQRAQREANEAAEAEAQRRADIAACEARGEKYWGWPGIKNLPENILTMASIMAAGLNNN